MIHCKKKKKTPTSIASEEFKASRGWFDTFHRRNGIHIVIRHTEASSSEKAVAEAYKKEFTESVKAKVYVAQQVFNCN